jgi:hypothetical protein
MATGRRRLLVQYCIILNHISSLGAKKKESTNFDALCICVGDRVGVENHGKH